MLLNDFLLSRNDQDTSHKLYMWYASLAGNLILLCLATRSSMKLGPGPNFIHCLKQNSELIAPCKWAVSAGWNRLYFWLYEALSTANFFASKLQF